MTFEEYQKEAVKFRTESADNKEYLTLGLIEEVGEAAGKLAKRRRDGVWDEKAFIKELGDILWFVANLADYYKSDCVQQGCKRRFVNLESAYCQSNDDIKSLAVFASRLAADSTKDPINFACVLDWLVIIANSFGYTIDQIAEINLAKLRDRAARGKIQGNGDER